MGCISHHHRDIPGLPQRLGQHHFILGEGRPVVVGEDEAPCKKLGAVGDGGKGAGVGSIEDHGFLREPIEIGCADPMVVVAA